MLLECSCGKVYKLKDGTANPPTKCPKCGGTLKAATPKAPAGPDPRVKELEAKVQSLEAKANEAQVANAKVAALQKELEAARSKGTKVESAPTALLQKKDKELEELRTQISLLENKVKVGAPGNQTMALGAIKEKDKELEEAQASIARLGEEQGKAQQAYREALERKEKETQELNRRVTDLEKKLVEASSKAQASAGADAGKAAGGGEGDRAQARIKSLEKIIQDAENRYRALQKDLEAAQAKAGDPALVAEKDKRIAELEEEIDTLKADLQLVRAKGAQAAAAASAAEGPVDAGRLGEVRYLAGDLERNLETVSASLGGLVSRIQRLNRAAAALEQQPAEEAAAPPPPPPPPPPPQAAAALADAGPPPEPGLPPAGADEEVAELESLPEPAVEDALPQDETLLDMGKMGPSKPAPVPISDVAEVDPGDETPLNVQPVDDAEAGDVVEEVTEEPAEEVVEEEDAPSSKKKRQLPKKKKKGLFGFFGK